MRPLALIALIVSTSLLATEPLVCYIDDTSLYSVHKGDYALKRHNEVPHTLIYKGHYLILDGRRFNLLKIEDGISTFIRGRYLILEAEGNFYLRNVAKHYTWRMVCKRD